CATRLRYVPNVRRITLGFPLKQSQDVAEIVPHLREDLVSVRALDGTAFRQLPARTRDRKTAIVKQVLNLQHHLHVLATVDTVPCLALLRSQRRKLGFPVPQDKRFHACKFADFSNLEEKLVRDLRFYCARHCFLAPPRPFSSVGPTVRIASV